MKSEDHHLRAEALESQIPLLTETRSTLLAPHFVQQGGQHALMRRQSRRDGDGTPASLGCGQHRSGCVGDARRGGDHQSPA